MPVHNPPPLPVPNAGIDPRLVRWAPEFTPTTPTVTTLGTGFESHTYGDNEDVILVPPGTTRTSQLLIIGGRQVQMLGGKHVHATSGAGVQRQDAKGPTFYEGCHLDMTAVNADGFDAYGYKTGTDPTAWYYPDVTFQNCLIEGVNGTVSTTHADCFQVQGPLGVVRFYGCTLKTNYQGIFAASQTSNKSSVLAMYIDKTNIVMAPVGDYPTHLYSYALWFADDDRVFYPVYLGPEVYIDISARPDTQVDPAQFVVWPQAGLTADGTKSLPNGTVYGAYNLSNPTRVAWPSDVIPIFGDVKIGSPPGGDFAKATKVGIGYTSPGRAERIPPRRVTTRQLLPTSGTDAAKPPATLAGEGFAYYSADLNGGTDQEVTVASNVYAWTPKMPTADMTDGVARPEHRGWKLFSHDVRDNGGAATLTAGVVNLSKLWNPRTQTITNLHALLVNVPTVLVNCYLGLYDSTGARVAVTADLSSAWMANGATTGYVVPGTISGGPISLVGSRTTFYWLALLAGTATTAPSFGRKQTQAAGQINAGLTAATAAAGTILSGQSSLPSSITPSSIAITSVGGQIWSALS